MTVLQDAGIPAGRVANGRQLLDDPHLNSRDFFVEIDDYDYGPKRYEGQAIRGNHMPARTWKPSHRMGQDNRNILKTLLGYSDKECDAFADDEVVGSMDDSATL